MPEKVEPKSAYDQMNVDATLEKIVAKIGNKEHTEDRIQRKMQELDGFVTRIGAMQLVARELGVKIEWKTEEVDLSKVYRIRLSEVPTKPKKDYVEVAGVITRASPTRMSDNKRSYQFFTIDDGETALDLIIFGQAMCGMFQTWMDKKVLIRPLRIGEYKGEPQLQVVDQTQIIHFEEPAKVAEPPPTTAPEEGGT